LIRPFSPISTCTVVTSPPDYIRDFHKTGRTSLKAFPDRLPVGQGERLGKAAGMNRGMAEKSRAFAAAFSNNDLEKLCHRIKKDDFRFGLQHLVRLMRLPGQQQRWDFLDKAIKGRWSCRQLAAEIRQKTGRRPNSGRTPVITNRADAILKLQSICEQWRRMHGVITGGEDGDGAIEFKFPPRACLMNRFWL
jgi:hypothetical protein